MTDEQFSIEIPVNVDPVAEKLRKQDFVAHMGFSPDVRRARQELYVTVSDRMENGDLKNLMDPRDNKTQDLYLKLKGQIATKHGVEITDIDKLLSAEVNSITE